MRQYIHDLMHDADRGSASKGYRTSIDRVMKLFLLVVSYMYGALVKAHYFFYKVNLLKSYKPRATVISVGNITLGGTGKTPFTIMLARRIAQKNKTAVLIRGYGEDEWKLLEDSLGRYGIKVFVGRQRVKSAGEALRHGFDTLILDDGFQHRPLRRDLEIVLIDSTNPFGNKRLFPRGILREPLDGLKRADIFVLTKVDAPRTSVDKQGKTKENISDLINEIETLAPGKIIVKAAHKPKNLLDIAGGEEKELSFVSGKRVCVLSGICDPSYFRHTIEALGAEAGLEFAFPDHHPYTERDLKRIFEECGKKNIDTVITTEKDAVKLKNLFKGDRLHFSEKNAACPLFMALRIELEIVEGEKELDDSLYRLYMRHSRQSA